MTKTRRAGFRKRNKYSNMKKKGGYFLPTPDEEWDEECPIPPTKELDYSCAHYMASDKLATFIDDKIRKAGYQLKYLKKKGGRKTVKRRGRKRRTRVKRRGRRRSRRRSRRRKRGGNITGHNPKSKSLTNQATAVNYMNKLPKKYHYKNDLTLAGAEKKFLHGEEYKKHDSDEKQWQKKFRPTTRGIMRKSDFIHMQDDYNKKKNPLIDTSSTHILTPDEYGFGTYLAGIYGGMGQKVYNQLVATEKKLFNKK